jgi:hypothetical protein
MAIMMVRRRELVTSFHLDLVSVHGLALGQRSLFWKFLREPRHVPRVMGSRTSKNEAVEFPIVSIGSLGMTMVIMNIRAALATIHSVRCRNTLSNMRLWKIYRC